MPLTNDWRPSATWAALQHRAKLLAQTRRFFDERGFVEVQTPLLSCESIVDRHLDPIPVQIFLAGESKSFYLQTSPELAMKRLLAAGATAIYQIASAFRGGEFGKLHNPEFTMLEWYRIGDSYQKGMQLLSDFAQSILSATQPEIITYRQAFQRFADIDPFTADLGQLARLCPTVIANSPGWSRDEYLHWIMSQRVEPHLGIDRAVIVCDWPENQAALARIREGDPPVAERFELFFRGLELANGYHELADPQELKRRMENAGLERATAGHKPLPFPSLLHAAMESGLPECCGVAVGFDRLAMVAASRFEIGDVIAFPIDRA